jgi:hypothetical protein
MAITLTIDGIPITVASVKTAVALIQGLRRATASELPRVELRAERNGEVLPDMGQRTSDQGTVIRTAMKFLMAIRDAPDGAQTSVIMKALGVTDPRAIGSRTSTINKVLKSLGMTHSSVYYSNRLIDGRLWLPGDQLPSAIGNLRKLLADEENRTQKLRGAA